jgi:hypothetical protein
LGVEYGSINNKQAENISCGQDCGVVELSMHGAINIFYVDKIVATSNKGDGYK